MTMQEVRNPNNTPIKNKAAQPVVRWKWLKQIGLYGGAALLLFLFGFILVWFVGNQYKHNEWQNELRPSAMQNTLATATINANRGEYELARQQASDFFNALRTEIYRDDSSFDGEQLKNAQSILAQRDEINTLLARSDSASANRLTDLYFAFVQMKDSRTPE